MSIGFLFFFFFFFFSFFKNEKRIGPGWEGGELGIKRADRLGKGHEMMSRRRFLLKIFLFLSL